MSNQLIHSPNRIYNVNETGLMAIPHELYLSEVKRKSGIELQTIKAR